MENQPVSIFSKIVAAAQKVFSPATEPAARSEFEQLVAEIRQEWVAAPTGVFSTKISTLDSFQKFKNLTDKQLEDFALWMTAELDHAFNGKIRNTYVPYPVHADVCEVLLKAALNTKRAFNAGFLTEIGEQFLKISASEICPIPRLPLSSYLRQIGYFLQEREELSDGLPEVLKKIHSRLLENSSHYIYKTEATKLKTAVEALLAKSGGTLETRPFVWQDGDVLAGFGGTLALAMPLERRTAWFQLLHHAQKASGSKPTKPFFKELEKLLAAAPPEFFADAIRQVFQHLVQHDEFRFEKVNYQGTPHEYRYFTSIFLHESNATAVKGLVWASPFCMKTAPTAAPALLVELGNLADKCFKKAPGQGYLAAALGNATLWAMAENASPTAIGQLSRLKLRNIQNNTKSLIENYLNEVAQKSGMTVADLEDLSVPDFGLDENGRRDHFFDDYKARLRLDGIGKTSIEWFKPNGSPQKSTPSLVKEKFANELKQLAATAKTLATTSTTQRDRLDRTLRSERKMSFEKFEKTLLRHPLLGWLARRQVWKIERNELTVNAFWTGETWRDSHSQRVEWVGEGCTVQLWHPATSPTEETLRWRKFLEDLQILQPIKQAFREIYLLTDAEIRTRTYSNRFAAHLLKQHQFAALARSRGWQYTLLGCYDDGRDSSLAVLQLPEQGLRAEFWVNEVAADSEYNDTGIWNYVATDQVRFIKKDASEPMNLMDVPPVVLSEILRDADMFVGVASVGNDPQWQDSGGLPGHRDYWYNYSFGELSEMAKSQREILKRLLPRLKIAPVADLQDKFLVIRGKRRTYKIHLGSSNILMEPNDQYLCIVPDRSAGDAAKSKDVFLPFEGDGRLSLILSKAFLLADDDKITDSTITRQIGF